MQHKPTGRYRVTIYSTRLGRTFTNRVEVRQVSAPSPEAALRTLRLSCYAIVAHGPKGERFFEVSSRCNPLARWASVVEVA